MKIYSLSFKNNSFLPSKHTCDGDSISPELRWEDIPAGTKSLVLIMDDPDAPNGTPWTHWVIYNLPVHVNFLEENVQILPENAQFGTNSWGKHTYRGPCLPSGLYRYYFKLFALDIILDVPNSIKSEALMEKMQGHILDQAGLMGRYERKVKS